MPEKEFHTDISELPIIIQDYNVKLFDSNENNKFDIINNILETMISNNAFFIVDLNEIIVRYNLWKELLPNIKPYYAVKCNPDQVLLKLMVALGMGFDCASKNEIALVSNLQADKNKIIYANPCADYSQIQYARANDIDLLVFDGENALYKVKLYHPYAKLVLRIMVDDSYSKCRFNNKFGVDEDYAFELLNLAKTLKLNVIGVSFHVGSGCSSDKPYSDAIKLARKIFDKGISIGMKMNFLDIGGGFSGKNRELFENICNTINNELKLFSDIENLEIIAEPGRYFVETTHTLIISVIDKKMFINK